MGIIELAKYCYSIFPSERGKKQTFEQQNEKWQNNWINFAAQLKQKLDSEEQQPSLFAGNHHVSKVNLVEARKLTVQKLIELVETQLGIRETEKLARELGCSVDTLAKYKAGLRPQSELLVKNALIGLLS